MSTMHQTTYLRVEGMKVRAFGTADEEDVDLYLETMDASGDDVVLFRTIFSGTPAEMIRFERSVSLAVESATHQPGDDQ